jgi:predicted RNA-binding protein YlxR (DUF448 family)
MKHVPQRKCVVCNERRDKGELMRAVRVTKDDAVSIVLDATGKISGRGAYLCKNADCLAKAVKSRRLNRALAAEVPETVIEQMRAKITVNDEHG